MPNEPDIPGARPTIIDVARRAGVSKSLVSLVVHNRPYVSDRRREAVLAAMHELGYRPNRNARNLKQARTQAIGVVISDLANPWSTDFLEGMEGSLRVDGFHVLIGNGRGDPHSQLGLFETFLEYGVDGICLGGTFLRQRELAPLLGVKPTVVVHSPDLQGPNTDIVVNDYKDAAYEVVRHLVDLGHRRIAHIAGRGSVSRERRRGYRAAMKDFGLAADAFEAVTDFTSIGNSGAARSLLSRPDRPTAVFAVNDLVGLEVMETAHAMRLRIPDDLAVVGWDNTRYSALRLVSMSSVDNDNAGIGGSAAELLLRRIEHPGGPSRTVELPASLIARESSVGRTTPD